MRMPRPRRVRPDAGSHPAMNYRLPPTLAAFRRAAIVAIVIAVAAGGWSLYWLVLATGLRDGVVAWAEQSRGEGLDVRFDTLDLAGYPSSARVVIGRPTVSVSDGTWSWSGDGAELAVSPLAPRHVTVSIAGAQAASFGADSRRMAFRGTVRALTAEIIDDADEPAGSLTLRDLVMNEVGGSGTLAVGRFDADAKGAVAPEDAAGAPTVEIEASFGDVRLPWQWALPLGERITGGALEARLMGTLEPGPWPDALARWRDAGGTVEIARLEIEYGPLDLNANGTLALDGDNQPIGAFTTRIQGFFQAIDALRRRRLVDDRAAITAKLVLGALARKGADGERPILSIPLTLQDRLLYAGPVPLFEVPPIRWEEAP